MKLAPSLRFPGFDADWIEKPMGELLSFKNGYNASAAQYGSGVKFINVLDIIENDFITHDRIIGSVQIPPKDFEKNEVRYGQLLFQRSSETREEVGQANVYLDREHAATFGGFVIRGRPLVEFDPVFFNSMLKTAKPRKDITSRSGGSTRYNIGQESLEDIVVSIPSTLPQQRKIAEFLTAVDARIAQLCQKKALLEAYKKGVMQQLFTRILRFKDDHGNDFPEWEEKTLGEMAAEIRSGLSMDQNTNRMGYKVTRIETIADRTINLDKIGYVETDKDIEDYRLLPGDILFSNINSVSHIGKVALVDRAYDLYQGMNLLRIRPGSECEPQFLFQLLKSDPFVQYFQRICNQAVSQASINQTALKKTPVRFPSLAEQQRIANFLTALDRKIEAVAAQIALTQTWKKGLLQQMFV